MKSKVIEERVRRGAALLDRVRPGWAAEIALDQLGMHTCNRCILGQLYGDFMRGFRALVKLLLPSQCFSAAKHGFTLFEVEKLGTVEAILPMFGDLAEYWRAAVRERLGGHPT